MPVPKRRTSRARRNSRRSHHHISAPAIMECKNCHQMKKAHNACPNCGYYDGRSVFVPKE